MRKKDALTVIPKMSNVMAKPKRANNASAAKNAAELLSGAVSITAAAASNTGLSYGLEKATISVSYAIYRDTAVSRSKVSKITGSTSYPKNSLIIGGANTLYMTPPIFIRMAA